MKYAGIFALLILLSACNKETRAEKDDLTLSTYIAEHGLTATKTSSGLYVVIDDPGTGASCNGSSTVKVAYTGYYDNNEVFDSNTGATFSLSGVIEGWREGIPYFKVGGSGKLLIPSALGYGASGSGPIAGNTVLIFDIELLDVL